jgi:hypothetical protein
MDLNEKINFQEYDILMSILSNFKKDKLVDCLKESHNGVSQITYGDVIFDEEKKEEVPRETVLTHPDDFKTL